MPSNFFRRKIWPFCLAHKHLTRILDGVFSETQDGLRKQLDGGEEHSMTQEYR